MTKNSERIIFRHILVIFFILLATFFVIQVSGTNYGSVYAAEPKVTLDANGGWFNANREVTVKEALVSATGDNVYEAYFDEIPDKGEEWEFLGWSLEKDGALIIDIYDPNARNYPISSDTTFYAKWKKTKYVITLDAGEGGSFDYDERYYTKYVYIDTNEFDSSYIPNPTKDRYIFDHWLNESGKRVELYDASGSTDYKFTKDETFTAVYKKATRITFKANLDGTTNKAFYVWGESGKDEFYEDVLPGDSLQYYGLDNYSTADHKEIVKHWVDESGNIIDFDEYAVPQNDVTLYAVWEDALAVYLHAGEGSFTFPRDEKDRFSGTYRRGVSLWTYDTRYTENNERIYYSDLEDPEFEGKIFDGWFTDAALTQRYVNHNAITQEFIDQHDGELHLYAGYTDNYATVTMHANGGRIDSYDQEISIKLPVGTAIDLQLFAANRVRKEEGDKRYIMGWFANPACTVKLRYDREWKYLAKDGEHIYPKWGNDHFSTINEAIVIGVKKTAVYSGKAIKPSISVTHDGVELIKNAEYTVKYGTNKKVGVGTVTITGTGYYYSGTKTITFKILPKKTKLKSLKSGKKSIKVKWAKQTTEVSGYEIQYSLKKNFKNSKKVTIKKKKLSTTTIKKLKSAKKYYVRIRTYKTVGKKKYYSDWSNVKSITTK